jgi:hypothetical protein
MKKDISRIIQINEANELPATGHSSQPKKKMGRPFSVYDRKKAALSKNGNNGTCSLISFPFTLCLSLNQSFSGKFSIANRSQVHEQYHR